MKKLLFFLFVYSTISVCAQDFQWTIRGGGKNTMQTVSDYNNILAIERDANDNIYCMGRIAAALAEVDGNPVKTYNSYTFGIEPDIVLTSFTKDGVYRWTKIIGGGQVRDADLKVANGLVYVCGYNFPNDSAYYDSDTTVYDPITTSGLKRKGMFLIQYDTSGTYNWLRLPDSDSVPINVESPDLGYWMHAEPNGEIYWLAWLKPGALRNTAVPTITQEGIYVMHYDVTGQILDVIELDMNHDDRNYIIGQYGQGNFIRNRQTGEFYVGATCNYNSPTNQERSLTIGGDTVKGSMYLAKFNSNGQLIWLKQSDTTEFGTVLSDFELDGAGNIYIMGGSNAGKSGFNNTIFTSSTPHGAPFVVKLRPDGTTVFQKFGVTQAVSPSYQLSLNGYEFAITGYHGGLYFQGANDNDTLKAVGNQGYDMYIARFDTANGDLIGLKSAQTSFGSASYGYSLGVDSEGAYYIGGNYNGQLFLGPDSLFPLGSQRTFFLTKYACTPLQATFAVQADTLDGAFTFSGTANQAIDSIVWDFDNGHQLTGDSVGYQYFTVGTYIVCGTAYTGCGDSTFCDTLFVNKVGLEENRMLSFSLSPNPASETVKLHLPYATSQKLQLNITGINGQALKQEQLNEGVKQHEISLDGFAPGIYLLLLYDEKQVLVGKEKMMVR